ncbi:FadR family transcriptional regulator [Erythrobacter litoralis]|uniref:FadR/GntR family transcriptional regulator n=1 Tax=Erythrobacter litoralis TaxID=39960 RepID=UPI00243487EB|nr:FCD domain-containing protein [Erythrobacter litoralis]MDG6079864.1 FadR family transcriptional regulator [Erythrobacter litoralis]
MAEPKKKQREAGAASAVDEAAKKLRIFALSKQDEEFLGSEEDMIDLLKVSRPTLRQASARVVQENLIKIKRGVGGGYFATRPGSLSVSRMAALYLMSRNAGLSETTAAMKPLRAELAKRAAWNQDPEQKAKLKKFIDCQVDLDANKNEADGHGYREFLRSERLFGEILGEMSENAVLTLLLDILYDFTAQLRREQDVLINRPDRVETYRKLRLKLASSILEGDVEMAEIASHRCSDTIEEWMAKSLENTKFGDAVLHHG